MKTALRACLCLLCLSGSWLACEHAAVMRDARVKARECHSCPCDRGCDCDCDCGCDKCPCK